MTKVIITSQPQFQPAEHLLPIKLESSSKTLIFIVIVTVLYWRNLLLKQLVLIMLPQTENVKKYTKQRITSTNDMHKTFIMWL